MDNISADAIVKAVSEFFSSEVVRKEDSKLFEDGENFNHKRPVLQSHWIDKDSILRESMAIRSAFVCFDTLYSFLAAAQTSEKAFFSTHLRIFDNNQNVVASDYGHCLGLKSIDTNDEAFDKVAALISHVRDIAKIKETDLPGKKTTVVIDASVCSTPGCPRSPSDNTGVIRLAELAIRALFEIAQVDSTVQPIRVVPGAPFSAPAYSTALAFVTADWDCKENKAGDLVRKARTAAQDEVTNIDDLLASVDTIQVDQDAKNIVMLGNTGAGKSYTANWILDVLHPKESERFIESEAGSMTSFVDYLPRDPDHKWRVWDTPGLNDSYGRDNQFIHDIERALVDAGCIHAVALCFASLERIDHAMKESLKVFSRILGRELPKRLLVFVNRQPTAVNSLQRKNLMNEIRVNCGIKLDRSQIFDMSEKTGERLQVKDQASRVLLRYCYMEGVMVGQIADVFSGLKDVRLLKDQCTRDAAKKKLVELSAAALRKMLAGGDRKHPVRVQPSFGTSIILSSGKKYEMKDGYERVLEYHLEMPQHVRKRFDQRCAVFGKCLFLWNADVEKVINVVKSMELVFRMLPEERSEERRRGVLRMVYKVRLKLWGIDDALLDDTKFQVQRALGNQNSREVSYFTQGQSSLDVGEMEQELG